jgi:hypothetical protein
MVDFASRNVVTSFKVSRKSTAVGIELFLGWGPGLTVTTNRLSFLVIPQKVGAICRLSFLLPDMLTISNL